MMSESDKNISASTIRRILIKNNLGDFINLKKPTLNQKNENFKAKFGKKIFKRE